MTAIMKIAAAGALAIALSGCAQTEASFYPPIATQDMLRVLNHPAHPGVVTNGRSIHSNRQY